MSHNNPTLIPGFEEETDIIIIPKQKLELLLKIAFRNGADSLNKWSGQMDTCWSNVEQDMNEDVELMMKNLKKPTT